MKQLKHVIILVLVTLLVAFVAGFFVARERFAPPAVTSEILLTTIQNEGFFVTQEIILEETVTIDSRTGNAFRDFFVGEMVEAEADLRIALGIDTSNLTAEQIQIKENQIIVQIPQPTIFSTEILGDVDIDSDRGIITSITSGEEDYNGLVATLKEQARASIAKEEIRSVVEQGTIESLSRFLSTVAPRYTPVVTFN